MPWVLGVWRAHTPMRPERLDMPSVRAVGIVASPLALIALFAAAFPVAAMPQDTVRVSSDASCADCSIVLDTVVTIGGFDGLGLHVVDQYSAVAVDARERVLVSTIPYPEISVFDMSGEFVREIGGRGGGPGEYELIVHIDASPRYVHVFEMDEGRTLLDLDLGYVRQDRFPGDIMRTHAMASDTLVIVDAVATSGSVGFRLHTLSPTGEMDSYWEGGNGQAGRSYRA